MAWVSHAGSVLWDDEPASGYPPLLADTRSDICVVGLGGSGLTAVAEARRRGFDVIGIDAGAIAGGAAGRNGGLLLAGLAEFHHDVVARIGRTRAAAAYRLTLDELARMEGSASRVAARSGSLRRAASDDEVDDCRRHLAALVADGFPAEWYDEADGAGVLVPSDGVFQPLAHCRAEAAMATKDGACLYERTTAVAIESNRVTTRGGVVSCGAVVVAVDGGLEEVLPALASRVRTARLQMLATAPDPLITIPRPVYSRWGYDYWHQRRDGRIVLGGCRDRFAASEWSAPAEPTDEVQACLDTLLRETIGSDAPVTHRWAGRVAFTDDRLPLVEEVADGVVAVGGYSGTGNVVGRLCGRAAVELVLDGRSETATVLRGPA